MAVEVEGCVELFGMYIVLYSVDSAACGALHRGRHLHICPSEKSELAVLCMIVRLATATWQVATASAYRKDGLKRTPPQPIYCSFPGGAEFADAFPDFGISGYNAVLYSSMASFRVRLGPWILCGFEVSLQPLERLRGLGNESAPRLGQSAHDSVR